MQPIFTAKFAGFARTVQLKKDEGNTDPTALNGMLAAIDQGSPDAVYVMSVEDCSIYRQSHNEGYEGYRNPSDPGLKYLRAIDIYTGETVWEIPQQGPQEANYSGVLTTAGGLVFYGETGGGFAAVDAKTGKTLWTFHGNQAWRGCPMTYMLNGRQYIAVASGSNILTFALR